LHDGHPPASLQRFKTKADAQDGQLHLAPTLSLLAEQKRVRHAGCFYSRDIARIWRVAEGL
jgi:hypothetical protein